MVKSLKRNITQPKESKMNNKPVISIEDGCFVARLSEPFNESNMVEKYTNFQALIDLANKSSDDENPNEGLNKEDTA